MSILPSSTKRLRAVRVYFVNIHQETESSPWKSESFKSPAKMPGRSLLPAIFMLIFIIAVSASVTEKILQIPLLEVGGLWVKATQTATARVASVLTISPDLTSPWTYARAAILVWLGYLAWAFFWRPLNRVRKLGDVGYVAEGSFTTKETANFIQRRKKNGDDVPPFYPNGWFGLMESFYLKKGESQALNVLGKWKDNSIHITFLFFFYWINLHLKM